MENNFEVYPIKSTETGDNNIPEVKPLENLKKKKPWFKRPLFYVLLVVLLGLGYFSYVLGLAYNTIVVDNDSVIHSISGIFGKDQIDKDNELNPMPKPETDRYDVLILGIRGENDTENGGLLTDSIQVLSLDKNTKKATLVAIPRDLYIDMLGIHGKINSVYEIGFGKKAGIPLVSQVISRITGVYIDKTIVFDFEAFKNIVDSLGGIDVHLTKPFKETSQWGYEFSLPAGDNHLDGAQALYYVRSRYSSSDFDRARRQQDVMSAIKAKAFSVGLLSNPLKITSLFDGLKKNVRTDFQVWDISNMLTLAGLFNDPKSAPKSYVLSTANLLYETHTPKGEYILLPKTDNYDQIREIFKNFLAPSSDVKP